MIWFISLYSYITMIFAMGFQNIRKWFTAMGDYNLNNWSPITVTSLWTRWCLYSPASRLFTQPYVQAQIKENIKAPRHWPLWREFTSDQWIPRTKGQWREKCFHLMTSSCYECNHIYRCRRSPISATLGNRQLCWIRYSWCATSISLTQDIGKVIDSHRHL